MPCKKSKTSCKKQSCPTKRLKCPAKLRKSYGLRYFSGCFSKKLFCLRNFNFILFVKQDYNKIFILLILSYLL